MLIAMQASAGQEWCRTSDSYCFTTLDGHKLVQVPWTWRVSEIASVRYGAKVPGAVPPIPDECIDDGREGWVPPDYCPCEVLAVGPRTCEE